LREAGPVHEESGGQDANHAIAKRLEARRTSSPLRAVLHSVGTARITAATAIPVAIPTNGAIQTAQVTEVIGVDNRVGCDNDAEHGNECAVDASQRAREKR
jgi:hypothetical protein